MSLEDLLRFRDDIPEDTVLDIDKYDTMLARRVVDTHVEFRETCTEINNTALGIDTFHSLFKMYPIKRPEEQIISPVQKQNYNLIDAVMMSPKFPELRELTRLNTWQSADSAVTLIKDLIDKMPPPEEPQGGQGEGEGQPQQQPSPGQGDEEQDEQEQEKQEGQGQQEKQEQKQQEEVFKATVNEAVKKATEEAKENESLMTTWGTEEGDNKQVSFEERDRLKQLFKNNKKFQDITKMAGRFKSLALSKRQTKSIYARSEHCGITLGDELERILPVELLNASKKSLRLLFYKKLVEKELLQYEMTGKDPLCRGPIVMCLDSSGSMNGNLYGCQYSREVVSKAIAIGMYELAKKDKRKMVIIHFGNRYEQKVFHITDKKALIEAVQFFFNGGTDFVKALKNAREIIQKEKDFKKADIIFVTDGECYVDDSFEEEFIKDKKEMELSMYTILISCGEGSSLDNISDSVTSVSEFSEFWKVAGNLYQKI